MSLPQIVFGVMLFFDVIVAAVQHGQPREDSSVYRVMWCDFVIVVLLWWGGFWS